ncbi:HypC/HybG/HupF family hydrogenase formation chaperone [Candidatus Woesearchaeota archaeon]|nr:MAG: HypC/HybG/HupF family hydrogenase formation chaperone [Candidatus Woesearchaeota archaeon]
MCFAVPGKVIAINDKTATLDFDGQQASADISLLDHVKKGDYVLVQAGMAVEKVPPEKAKALYHLLSP